MARSRRACPERSRGNPGDACWQMLVRAFRPQTTTEAKKSHKLRAYPDFLPHRSHQRPLVWFSLKRTTCSRSKPQLSTGNPGEPTFPGAPWRDLQFRGRFLEMFSTTDRKRGGVLRRPRGKHPQKSPGRSPGLFMLYPPRYWLDRTLARCVSACLAAVSNALAWGK